MLYEVITLLTVWASSQLNSRTIDVSQHGVLPEMDATLALVQLIETLKDESDVTLLFPKGVYEFYPENAYEQYRAVANHDNSLKRMAFPIFNSKNFTIDGGASTFIFHVITSYSIHYTKLYEFPQDRC